MTGIDFTAIAPDGWEPASGYAYAVRAHGRSSVHVSGQIASRDGKPVEPGLDMAAQCSQVLSNIATLVRAAGGQPENIVAMRVYVTDVDAFHAAGEGIGAAWVQHLGMHFPAVTMVGVSRLSDPNAVVEAEVEAVLP